MFVAIIISLYFTFGVVLLLGWFRTKQDQNLPEALVMNHFSIVIAMRDEAENLPKLIESLRQIDYPKEAYEIILIDDHSSDASLKIAKQSDLQNLSVIQSIYQGKKSAIKKGVAKARFEYIIQTDADCSVPKNWLRIINQKITKQSAQLIAAPLIIKDDKSIFSKLQALESYALLATTAGCFAIHRPIMMNAANAIFSKSLFEKSNLKTQETASGDDIFLLHSAKKNQRRTELQFLNHLKASVTTNSCNSFEAFWQQRLRWASKSKYYQDVDTIVTGVLMAIIHFSILVMLILTIIDHNYLYATISLWLTKSLVDGLILLPVLRYYKKNYLLMYFPLLALVYPFYVSFVGVFALFTKYHWKNRTYDS